MNLLDRYIARAILLPSALALVVLLVLDSAYLFIDEQSNIGQGSYSMFDAASFVLLSLPRQLFELAPAAVLVGAMIGLGDLSQRSEIVAMRAAGISVWRLALTLAGVGVFVVLLVGLVGEYLAPQSTAIAFRNRAGARTQHEGTLQGSTIWVHDEDRYLRIETSGRRNVVPRVTTFDVTQGGAALTSIGRSDDVTVDADGAWVLKRQRRILYGEAGLTEVVQPSVDLHLGATNALLDAATEPGDRSVEELLDLTRQLRKNHQDARVFIFALWSRVAHAVAAFWCVLLALPFAFGNLRAAKAGVRVFVAVGIGIVFVLCQQLVESGVVLSSLPPAALAWLPTAVLAVVTSALVLRVR